jgi:uncharacterized protein YhfF
MTWPRINDLRALELGTPGDMRDRLNALVLARRKRATAGVLDEYEQEGESLEHPGERLALLDNDGQQIATIEVTSVEIAAFSEVPWEFAAAEGEGHRDLEEWRAGHQRFWTSHGTPVQDHTPIVMLRFQVA